MKKDYKTIIKFKLGKSTYQINKRYGEKWPENTYTLNYDYDGKMGPNRGNSVEFNGDKIKYLLNYFVKYLQVQNNKLWNEEPILIS